MDFLPAISAWMWGGDVKNETNEKSDISGPPNTSGSLEAGKKDESLAATAYQPNTDAAIDATQSNQTGEFNSNNPIHDVSLQTSVHDQESNRSTNLRRSSSSINNSTDVFPDHTNPITMRENVLKFPTKTPTNVYATHADSPDTEVGYLNTTAGYGSASKVGEEVGIFSESTVEAANYAMEKSYPWDIGYLDKPPNHGSTPTLRRKAEQLSKVVRQRSAPTYSIKERCSPPNPSLPDYLPDCGEVTATKGNAGPLCDIIRRNSTSVIYTADLGNAGVSRHRQRSAPVSLTADKNGPSNASGLHITPDSRSIVAAGKEAPSPSNTSADAPVNCGALVGQGGLHDSGCLEKTSGHSENVNRALGTSSSPDPSYTYKPSDHDTIAADGKIGFLLEVTRPASMNRTSGGISSPHNEPPHKSSDHRGAITTPGGLRFNIASTITESRGLISQGRDKYAMAVDNLSTNIRKHRLFIKNTNATTERSVSRRPPDRGSTLNSYLHEHIHDSDQVRSVSGTLVDHPTHNVSGSRPVELLSTSLRGNSLSDVSNDTNVGHITIAIMGGTGCGKSTFINLVTGSSLGVSNGLESCTQDLQEADLILGRRAIRLIDTPGFDDTGRSEVEILKLIASSLANYYKQGHKIHGILYFHRISDIRMGGASRRSFRFFRKLCGDAILKKVLIVTTMWDKIPVEEGKMRENELFSDGRFFDGAQMRRHNNTIHSAQAILNDVCDRAGRTPLEFRVQTELNRGKRFSETTVGVELSRHLSASITKLSRRVSHLEVDITGAVGQGDEQTVRELEGELLESRREYARVQNEMANLKVGFDSDVDIEGMWKAMDREAKVMLTFRRSIGAEEAPERFKFWAALGDTTKSSAALGSTFEKYPISTELYDALFYEGSSDALNPQWNRDLTAWMDEHPKAVKEIDTIMEKAIRKAKGQKKPWWRRTPNVVGLRQAVTMSGKRPMPNESI